MRRRSAAPAALLVLLAACALRHDPCPGRGTMRETQLFFGLGRADGPAVSDGEWRTFVRDVVTPRFPAGLTVLDAEGQYTSRRSPDVQHEHTRIVVLVHDGGDTADTAIDEIVRDYRRRFAQESVLRVDMSAAVAY